MTEQIPPHRQLKQEREKRAWTQAQAAEMLEAADANMISRWERGENKPQPFHRVRISKLFNIPIEAWIVQDADIKDAQEELLTRPSHEDEQAYPEVWTIPFDIPIFIGRQDVLQRLHEALLKGKTTALTQVISGLGGIGKTLTAAKYALKYREQYNAVFWIEADTREKLLAGLLKMADDLNFPEKQLEDTEQILAAVKLWMREKAHWLLILDNVEDMSLFYELLPSARRGHVLLTTRKQPLAHEFINIELSGLSLEEGALLLLQIAGRLPESASREQANAHEKELAQQISYEMEGLPLALEQAGAYIREQQCSLTEYLEWYKTRRAYILSWRSSQPSRSAYTYPDSVATTWSLSFEKIRQESSEAVDLLSFFAFLDPDAIPEELILLAASEAGPRLKHISDLPALLEVLAFLRRYSFVRRDKDRHVVNIHRLVQAVFSDNMDAEGQKRWAEQTIRALYKALSHLKEKPLSEQDDYFAHGQKCYEWIMQISMHFSEAAQLLLLLGSYAQKRLFYGEAEKYLVQAVAIIERIRASGHIERALAYNNIAALYEEMGQYSLAETYFRKAMPILEKNTSPEIRVLLARVINNLAGTLEKLNKLVEAEQHAYKAVEMARQIKNVRASDIVYALNTYEVILYRLHKNEEAQRISAQIKALFHPEHASDLDKARMLEKQGEEQEPMQIDLLEEALTLYQQVHGSEHRDIAHCLSAIGAGYMGRKNYNRAKPYYQQALEMYKSMKLEEHDDVVIILMQLAQCSLLLRQSKEAKMWFEQAKNLAQKNPSPYVSQQTMEMFQRVLEMHSFRDEV